MLPETVRASSFAHCVGWHAKAARAVPQMDMSRSSADPSSGSVSVSSNAAVADTWFTIQVVSGEQFPSFKLSSLYLVQEVYRLLHIFLGEETAISMRGYKILITKMP